MEETKNVLDYKSNTSLFLSCFLHGIILFTILCVLYITVIEKLTAAAFEHEINSNLDDSLPEALKNFDINLDDSLPEDLKNFDINSSGSNYFSLKKSLKSIPLDKIASIYSSPDPNIEAHNNWLKNFMIFSLVSSFAVIIVSCVILYFSCGKKINFFYILLENIIIFIFVGIFEAFFFLNIGSKYIPVPPSFIINTIYSDLKKW
jgi:magnesium-transporting ATPase (P-type)